MLTSSHARWLTFSIYTAVRFHALGVIITSSEIHGGLDFDTFRKTISFVSLETFAHWNSLVNNTDRFGCTMHSCTRMDTSAIQTSLITFTTFIGAHTSFTIWGVAHITSQASTYRSYCWFYALGILTTDTDWVPSTIWS